MRINGFSSRFSIVFIAVCGLFGASQVPALETVDGSAAAESDMRHGSPEAGTDHSAHATPPQTTGGSQRLDSGAELGERTPVRGLGGSEHAMHDMGTSSMQGGKAPSDARDPDYSDGHDHGPMAGMDMQDNASRGMLLIDRWEYFNARESNGQAFEGQAWYGNDRNKLRIRTEGDIGDGRLEHLRSELLWDHAVSAYWDSQLGVRHDSGVGPDRTWAAFGVQGLAPYWFEVGATAYLGQAGRTAFRVETEYELLLTQRLVVQPRLEANFYGRNDPQRGLGSGLSDAAFGIRLRYEFRRKFAPYAGVEWIRKFGSSADYARTAQEPILDRWIVAGLHFWL